MSDCKCGHLVCTFPDCDSGEPAHPVFDKPQPANPIFDGFDDPLVCRECGRGPFATCDSCFNTELGAKNRLTNSNRTRTVGFRAGGTG